MVALRVRHEEVEAEERFAPEHSGDNEAMLCQHESRVRHVKYSINLDDLHLVGRLTFQFGYEKGQLSVSECLGCDIPKSAPIRSPSASETKEVMAAAACIVWPYVAPREA